MFLFVPLVVGLELYFRLSNLSYTLITVFLLMHVVGSHYTYCGTASGFRPTTTRSASASSRRGSAGVSATRGDRLEAMGS